MNNKEDNLWTGDNAPQKLRRLPKKKLVPMPLQFVNDALEHLQALLDKGVHRDGDEAPHAEDVNVSGASAQVHTEPTHLKTDCASQMKAKKPPTDHK